MTGEVAGTVHLRPLAHGDLARVEELEHELFGAGAWSMEAYAEEIVADGRCYVAAVAPDGLLVGYAGISLGPDSEVMTVGVAAPWRRRGVGAGLVAALLDAARAAGARRVFLEVRVGADGARRLYERAGFRPVGVRRGYYQPENADALVMRLDLAGVGPVGGSRPGPGRAGGR